MFSFILAILFTITVFPAFACDEAVTEKNTETDNHLVDRKDGKKKKAKSKITIPPVVKDGKTIEDDRDIILTLDENQKSN